MDIWSHVLLIGAFFLLGFVLGFFITYTVLAAEKGKRRL